MRDFVHLHNYSDYSLRHSISTFDRMLARVKEIGQQSIALTDEGNLFGAVEFTQKCKEYGIRPIIGCELQVNFKENDIKSRDSDSLLLLTKNEEGFKNLKQLSTYGYTKHFYYYPRINIYELEQHKQGLFCIIPQKKHRMSTFLERGQIDAAERTAGMYKEIFDDSLLLEIQHHGTLDIQINKNIQKLGEKVSIPLIAGNACYYPEQQDSEAHKMYVQSAKTNRLELPGDQFYIKSRQEMERGLSEYVEALDRTGEIAQQCQYIMPQKAAPELPNFSIPAQFKNQDEYLRYLTMRGIEVRYKQVEDHILERVTYELDCIIEMGFSGYFLIIWDIINFCRKKDIPVGPGRGSVAGSTVSYALGISAIDPLRYGLLFERFLNPERIGMPDIDTDFCVKRRQEVINYIRNKYGDENCGQIITFSTLKPRGAIRDVGRSLDIPIEEVDSIAKLFREPREDGDDDQEKKPVTFEDYLQEEPRLLDYQKKYPDLFDITSILLGVKRHASLHAAGIVIGKRSLIHYAPLYKDSKTGGVATQYSMNFLEKVGLVKMDILGLRNITVVDKTEKMIQKEYPRFSLDSISLEDQTVYEMLSEGSSEAVFQFESEGMRQMLRKVRPTRIEELIALNALFRPGPIKFIDDYAQFKNGIKEVTYLDPDMKPILEDTYGVIVYQEQVMHIAQKFAGFSLGKADILRKAMGKKDQKTMKNMKGDFIEGVVNNGYTEKLAIEIFDLLVPFSKYGFNKSHSAAYSELAYKTAYLKKHYPLYYLVNILNADHSPGDKLAVTFDLCRSLDLTILPPDINKSDYDFVIEDKCIRYGLCALRNVSDEVKQHIPAERKCNGMYTSFFDVVERLPNKSGLKAFIESGIAVGLFDVFYKDRQHLIANTANIVDEAKKRIEAKQTQQDLLFIDEDPNKDIQGLLLENPVKREDALEKERENASTYLRYNPLDEYKQQWRQNTTIHLGAYKNTDIKSSRTQYLIAYTDEVSTRFFFKKNKKDEKHTQTEKDQAEHPVEKRKKYVGILHDYNGLIPFVCEVSPEIDIHFPLRKACGFIGYLFNWSNPIFKIEKVVSIEELLHARNKDIESPASIHDGIYSHMVLTIHATISTDALTKIRKTMMKYFGRATVKIYIQKDATVVSRIAVPLGFTIDANNEELVKYLNNHPDVIKIEKFL